MMIWCRKVGLAGAVAGLLCLSLVATSSAQTVSTAPALDRLVQPQDTVRVWSGGRRVFSGAVVVGVNSDTLWLKGTHFARETMTRLDVQTGRHPSGGRTARGTLIGLVGGATVFAFVGAGVGARSCSAECESLGNKPLSQGIGAFLLGTVGGISGAVAGFIIGHHPVPKWKTVLP